MKKNNDRTSVFVIRTGSRNCCTSKTDYRSIKQSNIRLVCKSSDIIFDNSFLLFLFYIIHCIECFTVTLTTLWKKNSENNLKNYWVRNHPSSAAYQYMKIVISRSEINYYNKYYSLLMSFIICTQKWKHWYQKVFRNRYICIMKLDHSSYQ